MRMQRGAGRRRGEVYLLPTINVGRDRWGIDVSVGFLKWYAYVELWRPNPKM